MYTHIYDMQHTTQVCHVSCSRLSALTTKMSRLSLILLKARIFQSTPSFAPPKNGMSLYPSYYIKPVFNKVEQEALYKSGEVSKLAHIPTKAALVDQTSSLFYDDKIALFTNYLMRKGNKQLARKLVEKTFDKVKRMQIERYHKASEEDKQKIILDPRRIFHMAIENCKPIIYLTPIKRGGVKYQVPVPITEQKAQFMSMNWLIDAGADKEAPVTFWDRMAGELIDASNNSGRVIKKKQDLHKQCEANRAYAHYRWS